MRTDLLTQGGGCCGHDHRRSPVRRLWCGIHLDAENFDDTGVDAIVGNEKATNGAGQQKNMPHLL